MKKLVFTLPIIFLLLAIACATPQAGMNTRIPSVLTATQAPLHLTPTDTANPFVLTPTDIPMATAEAAVSPQPPGILRIRRLQMIDANVGWGEGDVSGDSSYYLLRTTDGGKTWQDVTPPTRFSSPSRYGESLFAIDANTAWAFPPDYPFSTEPPYILVWRTNDGGKSWKASNSVDISDSFIQPGVSPRPQFADEKHGWLTLNFEHRVNAIYLAYHTNDGGITWEQTGSCYTYDGDMKGCDVPQFSDAQTGWLKGRPVYTSTGATDPATIWQVRRTLDGGRTWHTITLPHSQEQSYCSQWPAQVAPGIVGIRVNCFTPDGTEESYYYLSADRGQTWQVIPQPKDVKLIFLDTTTGWRLSKLDHGRQLERTMDGGVTWEKQADALPGEGLQFVDANTGWMILRNDSDPFAPIQLQRTTDGGKNWQRFTPRFLPAIPGEPAIARMDAGDALIFKSIQMVDSLNGWAIGGNEYVFHTADGGKNWQDVTPRSGTIVAGRQLLALDAGHAWITMADTGGVWFTEDSGQTWQPVKASSIDFKLLDEKIGFRAEPVAEHTLEEFVNGSAGLTISKTTDGGSTWQPIDLPSMIVDTDKISLDPKAYPGGIKELMQDKLACGTILHTFSEDTIGLRVICKTYRLIGNVYSYVFILNEYYLSTDSGTSWNRWMSSGRLFSWRDDDTPVESEFFLPGGTGWRLKANQLLQTIDGGKNWISLKAVGWEEARLDFINAQEGWGIVKSEHVISLVHTLDGGKTWEEIKPLVVNP